MIKGVIFDFDNTLYNYDMANAAAISTVIAVISETHHISKELLRITYNEINAKIKRSNNPATKFNKAIYIKNILQELNIPGSFVHEYLSLYSKTFNDNFVLYPNVVEFMKLLKKQQIKIGILSNNNFLQQYEKLQQANITQYIDCIQTSDECGEEKPHINMFLHISHKMNISFNSLAYIGDNFDHDILPALSLFMLPFHFVLDSAFKLENKYIIVGDYNQLYDFFTNTHSTTRELIFLSKYFGQCPLTTQGPGGNISVKMSMCNLMLIKSSGAVLGNISQDSGYCVVDKNKTKDLKEAKLFGHGNPSMETHFHSFMKKYTVHVHFTLANIFLCSEPPILNEVLYKFDYNHKVIDYCPPGMELAKNIKEQYEEETNIYFLKNHGLIITADSYPELLSLFEYIYFYFNNRIPLDCSSVWESFKMTKNMYEYDNSFRVVRKTDIDPIIMKTLVYCFPDLAVFLQKVSIVEDYRDLCCKSDVIIYKNVVYIVAENMTKLYYLLEIIQEYITLYTLSKGKLVAVMDVNYLQNMEEEKLRRL